jgi:hypothetical protein
MRATPNGQSRGPSRGYTVPRLNRAAHPPLTRWTELAATRGALEAWLEVAARLLEGPPHREACIPASSLPHPRLAGMRRTLGFGRGAHYSLTLPGGARLHVRVRRGESCYRVHWDLRDPLVDPVGHLLLDAPRLSAVLGGLVNTLSGLAGSLPLSIHSILAGLLTGVTSILATSILVKSIIYS